MESQGIRQRAAAFGRQEPHDDEENVRRRRAEDARESPGVRRLLGQVHQCPRQQKSPRLGLVRGLAHPLRHDHDSVAGLPFGRQRVPFIHGLVDPLVLDIECWRVLVRRLHQQRRHGDDPEQDIAQLHEVVDDCGHHSAVARLVHQAQFRQPRLKLHPLVPGAQVDARIASDPLAQVEVDIAVVGRLVGLRGRKHLGQHLQDDRLAPHGQPPLGMCLVLHRRRPGLAEHLGEDARLRTRRLVLPIPHRIPLVHDAVHARLDARPAAQHLGTLVQHRRHHLRSCRLLLCRGQHHRIAHTAPGVEGRGREAVLAVAAILAEEPGARRVVHPYPEVR
mmetsp:Transcript_87125/g.243855  ORF Transcript_87125/g.243855 Transcript_87125/m.243855 type:complete len:334 (+) Transcript_87125:824-1825(+)